MGAPLAVATAIKGGGIVVVALAAAGAFFLRTPRARALAALLALALCPVLLVGELWHSSQVESVRERPLAFLAVAIAGLALVAALAALFAWRPPLLPVLAVAALPFRVPVEAGGDTALLLVPLYLVVAGGGLAYVWERLRPPPGGPRLAPAERPPGRVELALLAAVVLYAVQSSYSTDFETALKNVVFFYVPFALLLKLIASLEWTARIEAWCLRVTVALAALFVLVGFGEYATRRLLWNPSVIQSNELRSYFRVNSLFFDPNIYGRYLALVMVALAALLLWTERRRAVAGLGLLLALLWAGLVLSLSQSSFAALLVGLAVLAAVRWRARPVVAAAAAAAVVGVAVVVAAPGSVHLQGYSVESLNRATSGRVELMRGGLRMFADRPLYGYGAGSFAERFRARERKGRAQAASASHTIPITVAAEQGVIGLAVYLYLLAVSFRMLFGRLAALREPGPPEPRLLGRLIVAAAFAALVFHTLLYAAFLEDPTAWALLGLGIVLRPAAPRPRRARRDGDRGDARPDAGAGRLAPAASAEPRS
ncbi:MAG: O-antigen ligase family protein [Thermoleophilaceae bacterium]|nr:O-antigen ligase family protein [Thermoleophilaceae bacterium]